MNETSKNYIIKCNPCPIESPIIHTLNVLLIIIYLRFLKFRISQRINYTKKKEN